MADAPRKDRATELDALHQELTDKVGQLATSDEWLAALQTARQFHRYSAKNQLWLAMQGATGVVASYRTWQKIPATDGGVCQVAKGQKGLSVLAPITMVARETDPDTGQETVTGRGVRGFKVVKVFAENQLVAPPSIPEPALPQKLSGPNAHQHLWSAIRNLLEDEGWAVTLEPRSADPWNGRTTFTARTVVVKDDLAAPQQLKTLIHEWAHIHLDHEHRSVPRDVKEIEAESVAYLTGATVGLDTTGYSIPYVTGWAGGDAELVRSTAEQVLTTTQILLDHLEHELGLDLAPDPLARHRSDITATVTTFPTRSTEATAAPVTVGQLPEWRPIPDGPVRPSTVTVLAQEPGNRLLPSERQQLYALLDTADGPPTPSMTARAAELLADAGCSAGDAIEIFRRCDVPDSVIIEALSQPYQAAGSHPEPLYTAREIRAAGLYTGQRLALVPTTATPTAAGPLVAGAASVNESAPTVARSIVDTWINEAAKPDIAASAELAHNH